MKDLSPQYRKLRIEPREYGEANHLGFSQTNIVKYATRYPFKDGAKDLKKVIECAAWLLKHEYDVTTYYEFSDDQREPQPSASVAPAPAAGKPRKKADAPKPKKNTGNTKPRTAAQLEALKRGRERAAEKRAAARAETKEDIQSAEN